MWFSAYRVVRLFLLSLVFGVCAGAYYDVFRIFRIARRPPGGAVCRKRSGRYCDAALCFAEDLVFWITLAAAYSVFIYDAADGRLRIVSLTALAAGSLCWFFTLGRVTARAAGFLISYVKKALRLVLGATLIPAFRLICAAARAVCLTLGKAFSAVFRRISGFAERRKREWRERKRAKKRRKRLNKDGGTGYYYGTGKGRGRTR